MLPSSTASEKPLSGSADQVKEVRSQSSYGGRPSYGIDSTVSSASLETGRPFDIQQSKEEFNIRAYQKQGIGQYPSENRTVAENINQNTSILPPWRFSLNANGNANWQLESFGLADRFKPRQEKMLRKHQCEVEILKLEIQEKELLHKREVQKQLHKLYWEGKQEQIEHKSQDQSENYSESQHTSENAVEIPHATQNPGYHLLNMPISSAPLVKENGLFGMNLVLLVGTFAFARILYPILSAFANPFIKKSTKAGQYFADFLFPEENEEKNNKNLIEDSRDCITANSNMLGALYVASCDNLGKKIRKRQVAKCTVVSEKELKCVYSFFISDPLLNNYNNVLVTDLGITWYPLSVKELYHSKKPLSSWKILGI